MDLSATTGLHIVNYSSIETDYDNRKEDFRDLLDSKCHFHKWHAANGLPDLDEVGKTPGSSQIFYKQYQSATDGESTCPLYVDMWHFFIDVMDFVGSDWERNSRDRNCATLPIYPGIIDAYEKSLSSENVEARTSRVANISGITDPGMMESLRKQFKEHVDQRTRAIEECRKVMETYGKIDERFPDLGKGFFIHLEV